MRKKKPNIGLKMKVPFFSEQAHVKYCITAALNNNSAQYHPL